MTLFVAREVWQRLDMRTAIQRMEDAFLKQSQGKSLSLPRSKISVQTNFPVHLMGSGDYESRRIGVKVYSPHPRANEPRLCNLFLLFDSLKGELLAIIETDPGTALRTGAVSGVATKYLASKNAERVGIIGSGAQARTQLVAVCSVRNIRSANVFSPNKSHRDQYCVEMGRLLGIDVAPCSSAKEAVTSSDVIVTATFSSEPVLDGSWIADGVHINAIGSNSPTRRELDTSAIALSDLIIVDSKEQAKIEAGDLIAAINESKTDWSKVEELSDVVSKKVGRKDDRQRTLFKSTGVASCDLAMADALFNVAERDGLGKELTVMFNLR